MSQIKSIVKDYLEHEPRARERVNKNRAIVNMLIERYPTLSTIPRQYLEEVTVEAFSMDRYWRKILEENEHLRGSDYNDKNILEDAMEVELGYEPDQSKALKAKVEKSNN